MKKSSDVPCPVTRALACVGDKWSFLILRDALMGVTRFDEFRRNLGIAPTILTQRLAKLTEDGALEKRLYSERPPREEYVLTEAGRDFLPILVMLGAWGRKHRGGAGVSRLVDASTGEDIVPVIIDEKTGLRLSDLAVRVAIDVP